MMCNDHTVAAEQEQQSVGLIIFWEKDFDFLPYLHRFFGLDLIKKLILRSFLRSQMPESLFQVYIPKQDDLGT